MLAGAFFIAFLLCLPASVFDRLTLLIIVLVEYWLSQFMSRRDVQLVLAPSSALLMLFVARRLRSYLLVDKPN